jgi:thymidylate kinase
MFELETKYRPRLAAIANLLDAFHEHDILYCHWKSNEHLLATMIAETDFDVLIDESQKQKATQLLAEFGFKPFKSIKPRQYKDIVDFIGLDGDTGKLIHLHTHFQLTIGEYYLKSYQLPWSSELLNNRVFNEGFGIYCCKPELELILLYVREALKQRNRDILSMYFRDRVKLQENILREHHWLKARVNETELYNHLEVLFKDPDRVQYFMNQPFNHKTLLHLAAIYRKEFAPLRQYSPLVALAKRWYREVYITLVKKSGRYLNLPLLTKRISVRGGLAVALIGADGSGKSSAVNELRKTFQEKLDVYSIYFGRGDGKVSWGRKQLEQLKHIISPERKKPGKTIKANSHNSSEGFVRSFYKCVNALLVAREKRNNLKRMQQARRKGMLVICDRFPQNQVFGYNDGPLLHQWIHSTNFLFRLAAKLESHVYTMTEKIQPDLVFKLIADADVVEKRKPGETSYEKLVDKIEGIKQLKFTEECKVITIDSSQSIVKVHSIIKNEIWKMI